MSDKRGEVKWINSKDNAGLGSKNVVDPKYSKVGERIRHITPSALQCSMFCGGKQCKYDNPTKWKSEEMAIRGLYSSWVTEKILATARPSSYAVKEFNVIEQFKKNNITAIINLQHPGEHSSCGFGLQASGFSYNPQDFMDEDVFFYNFGWDDYGVRALQSILDMVKVMDFALADGKVAIHCHAGLGRTGVLIACYFVYSQRMKADEAINTVRKPRPKSIQTRGQIACVRDFEKYLRPMWIVYANTPNEQKPFSLEHFLRRQTHLLHGEEERDLRYVPKIVLITCQRLLELAGVDFNLRTISVLKRRAFASLSHESMSSTSFCEMQESPSDTSLFSREESEGFLSVENSVSDSNSLLKMTKHQSDIGFLGGGRDRSEQLCVAVDADEADRYRQYALVEPDPTEYGGVEEIKPERTLLRHSSSESALIMAHGLRETDTNDPTATLHSSLKLALDQEVADSVRTHDGDRVDCVQSQQGKSGDSIPTSDCLNATNSVASLSMDSRKDSNDSGITSSSFLHDEKSVVDCRKGNSNSGLIERDADATRTPSSVLMNSSSSSVLNSESASDIPASSSSNLLSRLDINKNDLGDVLDSIACSIGSKQTSLKIFGKIEQYKVDLNIADSAWKRLKTEKDASILCYLLWNWLEHLQEPVITSKDLENISAHKDDVAKAFQSLDRGKRKTVQVLLFTFLKKTLENETPKLQQESREYIELRSFLNGLCKSEIVNIQ
eukprot:gene6955-7736_t